MPTRPAKSCPRCHNPYTGQRCPTCASRWHTTKALRAEADPTPSTYADPRWTAASRLYLTAHPLCECGPTVNNHQAQPDWRRPLATVVDHIDGLGPTGPRGYDPTNFAAMSRACHAVKTNRHDGGWGHKVNRLA